MAGSIAEAMGNAGIIPQKRVQEIEMGKKAREQGTINKAHLKLEMAGTLNTPHGVCPHCGQAVKTYKDKDDGKSRIAFHSFHGTTCEGSEQEAEKMI